MSMNGAPEWHSNLQVSGGGVLHVSLQTSPYITTAADWETCINWKREKRSPFCLCCGSTRCETIGTYLLLSSELNKNTPVVVQAHHGPPFCPCPAEQPGATMALAFSKYFFPCSSLSICNIRSACSQPCIAYRVLLLSLRWSGAKYAVIRSHCFRSFSRFKLAGCKLSSKRYIWIAATRMTFSL